MFHFFKLILFSSLGWSLLVPLIAHLTIVNSSDQICLETPPQLDLAPPRLTQIQQHELPLGTGEAIVMSHIHAGTAHLRDYMARATDCWLPQQQVSSDKLLQQIELRIEECWPVLEEFFRRLTDVLDEFRYEGRKLYRKHGIDARLGLVLS